MGWLARLLCMRKSRDPSAKSVQPMRSEVVEVHEFQGDNKKMPLDCVNAQGGEFVEGMRDIRALVQKLLEKEKDNETTERNRADWITVANIFNRIFLVVYFLIVVLLNIVIFGMMTVQAAEPKSGYLKNNVRIVND